jgi:hypothetical protein
VNFSLIKAVCYTGEQKLPVLCSVAEQKLCFKVSCLKLQLINGARLR